MFWKFNTNSSSQIEALLAKEDVTLQEVMDSDDIINECRVQNKQLIDFLVQPEIMEELVTLTVREPAPDIDERVRFKYSNIASELLTCDVPAINERLAGDETLLEKLYTFLDCEAPLNPLLASFFSKIMGVLIAKKTEQNWLSYQFTCLQVLGFLKAKEHFISLLLKHLGTSAIMDLMLKLFTQVEGIETKQNILNWLDSQRVMQSLVSSFNSTVDGERHTNIAQLLCDFIRITRDIRDNQRNSSERADPDPLLNALESADTVTLLLDNMLGENKCDSSITGGIQVLLALLDVYQTGVLRFNSQNTYNIAISDEAVDVEQKKKILMNITSAIDARIEDFHNILLQPPKAEPILTTTGTLDPPLGYTRLQVVKLFASIISSNNSEVLQRIISIGTFPVLLDLLFKYPWNNFLHTQVEKCLVSALKTYVSEDSNETSIALCKHLLENCKSIDRILDAWNENDERQKDLSGIRQGYMGHLINIVNKIVDLCSTTYLGQYLKDNLPEVAKKLDEFKENTLNETNKTQNILLGGAHPNSSNNNENDEFCDIPFPQSVSVQQIYSSYNMQHLTSQFIDGYSGFNDDTFNDDDNSLQRIDHRTDMNFDLAETDLTQQQEIFKQVCAQTINTLEDSDDQIFEDREHTFQTVIEKHGDQSDKAFNSDSDEDLQNDENYRGPWHSAENLNDINMGLINPWDNDQNDGDASWADFTAAFESNFTKAFEDSKLVFLEEGDAGTSKKPEDKPDNATMVVENEVKSEAMDAKVAKSLVPETNTKAEEVVLVEAGEVEVKEECPVVKEMDTNVTEKEGDSCPVSGAPPPLEVKKIAAGDSTEVEKEVLVDTKSSPSVLVEGDNPKTSENV